MQRKSKKQWPGYIRITMGAAVLPFLIPTEGLAAGDTAANYVATSGNAAEAPDKKGGDESNLSTTVETAAASVEEAGSKEPASPEKKDETVLSVELPVVGEEEVSPFNFILDPCGLVYESDAARYGRGRVEEGATILFHNKERGYAFSSCSDRLEIINKEEEPVIVMLSASVRDLEGISLVEREDLSENEDPCIYLALTDGQGNEETIFQDEEAMIRMELHAGAYSFGLTGACNTGADWQEVSVHPKVTVTWHVEPMLTETEEEPEWGEDIPSKDDITGLEPDQEDLGETSASDKISPGGEPDRMAEPKVFYSGTDILDYYSGKDSVHSKDSSDDVGKRFFRKELSGNASALDSLGDSRENMVLSVGIGSDVSEIPVSQEEPEKVEQHRKSIQYEEKRK